MDGMTKSESTLSSVCCASPGPYRPIRKFRVIGRMPTKTGHCSSHSTDFI